jgi:hypothetical protein
MEKNQEMTDSIPEPPLYKKGMSMTTFLREVEEFDTKWKSDKYNAVLKFINFWLANSNLSVKSLLDFRNVSEESLLKDKDYNDRLIKNNLTGINKTFSLNYKILKKKKVKSDEELIKSGKNIWGLDDDSDSDSDDFEIDNKEIIKLVKEMLNKIEYTLVRSNINGKYYYTIKLKKKSSKEY